MMEAMGMIPCEHVLDRLWDFIDGELSTADEEAVKRHLEICNRCYPQYNFQRAYFEYTRRIQDRDQAPPSLHRRLFEAILAREAKRGETP